MRLIDADELKKCAIPCEIHNGALTELCVPLYQIDNAPTVEPYSTYIISGKRFGKREDALKWLRPHGEWEANNYGEHHCNKCGHYALFEEDEDSGAYIERLSQHCPWCGAEMKTPN